MVIVMEEKVIKKLPEKRIIKSKYLLEINLDNGKYGLCSNITGAISLIDEEMKQLLERYNKPKYYKDICNGNLKYKEATKHLLERGMLVEEDANEKKKLGDVIKKLRENSPYVFTFVLTMKCNFRCIYCYESRNPMDMNWEVAEKCINFIVEKVKETKQKIVSIMFYGGEPLLKLDLMKKILQTSKKLLPKDKKILVSAITNGSLFTKNVAEDLRDYHCSHIQITLDGLKSVHDKRRPYATGKGSFEDVVNGIKNAIPVFDSVGIRMNVDKSNENHVPEFLKWIKDNDLAQKNITVSFGQVTSFSPESTRHKDLCIPSYEYGKKFIEFVKYAQKIGINSGFSIPRYLYCGAYIKTSVMFNPNGDIVSCLEGVGDVPDFVVGNVFNTPVYNDNAKNFFERSPLNFEKCRNCEIVGFCGTGCIGKAYYENNDLNTVSCPMLKYDFEGVVKTYIQEHLRIGKDVYKIM